MGITVHTHISVAFLDSNNTLSRKEIKKTFSFTLTSNKINCSAINLAKERKGLYTENYKTTKKLQNLVSYHITKVNSKCIKDINIRSETIKLLEGIIGENLDISLGDDFLAVTRKHSNKSKNRQLGPHPTKQLLYSEESHQQSEETVHGMEQSIGKPHV